MGSVSSAISPPHPTLPWRLHSGRGMNGAGRHGRALAAGEDAPLGAGQAIVPSRELLACRQPPDFGLLPSQCSQVHLDNLVS